jgi:hypothetical protein
VTGPSSNPSIKGTAFVSAHEDVRRLLEEGRLSRDELEAALPPEDLAILEEKISAGSWYPIRSYERLVEILVAAEAGGDREGYLSERGARAAERLAAAGIYRQLDLSFERLGSSVGRLAASLSGAIYNFGEWQYRSEHAGHFEIVVSDARDFPEAARLTAAGFIRCMASRIAAAPAEVTSERPAPDRVVFRADIRLSERSGGGAQGPGGSA